MSSSIFCPWNGTGPIACVTVTKKRCAAPSDIDELVAAYQHLSTIHSNHELNHESICFHAFDRCFQSCRPSWDTKKNPNAKSPQGVTAEKGAGHGVFPWRCFSRFNSITLKSVSSFMLQCLMMFDVSNIQHVSHSFTSFSAHWEYSGSCSQIRIRDWKACFDCSQCWLLDMLGR